MTSLTFDVLGRPAPQGSRRYVGHGVTIDASKRLKPWRSAVVEAAMNAMHAAGVDVWPLDGPVRVYVTFRALKPRSAPKRRWTAPTTRTSGDLDKLVRACLDGLTDAGVWRDDSQVVALMAYKIYPDPADPWPLNVPGATLTVLPQHPPVTGVVAPLDAP